jgi:hypothetical protein
VDVTNESEGSVETEGGVGKLVWKVENLNIANGGVTPQEYDYTSRYLKTTCLDKSEVRLLFVDFVVLFHLVRAIRVFSSR